MSHASARSDDLRTLLRPAADRDRVFERYVRLDGVQGGVELYGRVINLFDKWYQVSYGTQTLGLSAYGGVRLSF